MTNDDRWSFEEGPVDTQLASWTEWGDHISFKDISSNEMVEGSVVDREEDGDNITFTLIAPDGHEVTGTTQSFTYVTLYA